MKMNLKNIKKKNNINYKNIIEKMKYEVYGMN